MSDKESGTNDQFISSLGEIIGGLVVVNIWQTRAIMDLANAINKDPAISEATRESAKEALENVDRVIERLDKLTGKDAAPLLKAYFGDRNE